MLKEKAKKKSCYDAHKEGLSIIQYFIPIFSPMVHHVSVLKSVSRVTGLSVNETYCHP